MDDYEDSLEALREQGLLAPPDLDEDELVSRYDVTHHQPMVFPAEPLTTGDLAELEVNESVDAAVPYVTRRTEENGGTHLVRSFVLVFSRGNAVAFHAYDEGNAYDVVYDAASVLVPGKLHTERAWECLDEATFVEELDGREHVLNYHPERLRDLVDREREGEFGIEPPL